MKVLFFTNNYPGEQNPVSGIMVGEFVKAVRDLGVDLRVVHLDERLYRPLTKLKRYRINRCYEKQLKPDPEWVTRYRVTAWPCAAGISWRAKQWTGGLMKHISSIWPNFCPDVIHARTFIPCSLACERLAEEWNCPLVISTHGADTRYFIAKRATHYEIIRLCKKGIPIVCVSEFIREILADNGVDESNLTLIYNGIDVSKLYQGDVPLNGKYNDKYLVFGLGNLQPYKGFDIFIDAIAQLRESYHNIYGVIVGGGQEESKLRSQVQKLGLEGIIELTGAKPAKEAMEYMAACDIFCLPSWSEGFGVVYLEAMANGKPVIAVKGQGIDAVIREHSTGLLVEPKDVQSLVTVLRQLMTNEAMRNEMGEKGKKIVLQEFTWAHCAQKYLQLYSEVLANKSEKKHKN